MMQSSEQATNQAIIDPDGYRRNVGIVLLNQLGQIFWAKRVSVNAWQFPQGGIHHSESELQTLERELFEEVGLAMSQVEVLNALPQWLYYDLPKQYRRKSGKPYCVGQKQKWFLLKLNDTSHCIDLNQTEEPEFDTWTWVNYWYPISMVVDFKAAIYRKVLAHFAPPAFDHFSIGSLQRLKGKQANN